MTPDIEKKISQIVSRIVEGFHPEKVILFGSYARGDARPGSDVDLLIVVHEAPSKMDLTRAMYTHVGAVGLSKDIIVVTSDELAKNKNNPWKIYAPALKEGKILYDSAA